MKGFLALLFLAMLGFSAYNYWEIRELREEIAAMQRKMDERQASSSDAVIARAVATLSQARDALAHTDLGKARQLFDSARQQLDSAGRVAARQSGPAVKWLRDEAADISRRLGEEPAAH